MGGILSGAARAAAQGRGWRSTIRTGAGRRSQNDPPRYLINTPSRNRAGLRPQGLTGQKPGAPSALETTEWPGLANRRHGAPPRSQLPIASDWLWGTERVTSKPWVQQGTLRSFGRGAATRTGPAHVCRAPCAVEEQLGEGGERPPADLSWKPVHSVGASVGGQQCREDTSDDLWEG